MVSEFNNLLKFDATTLGNHEFDDKIAGLVPFMKVTMQLKARFKRGTRVKRSTFTVGSLSTFADCTVLIWAFPVYIVRRAKRVQELKN